MTNRSWNLKRHPRVDGNWQMLADPQVEDTQSPYPMKIAIKEGFGRAETLAENLSSSLDTALLGLKVESHGILPATAMLVIKHQSLIGLSDEERWEIENYLEGQKEAISYQLLDRDNTHYRLALAGLTMAGIELPDHEFIVAIYIINKQAYN